MARARACLDRGEDKRLQKVHAAAANALSERIHARLASATGSILRLSPHAVERLLGDLPRQLALTEAQLWTASQTAVCDINTASAALQDLLLTDKVRGIPLDTVVGMANDYSRFVTTAMETLTSIQSRTMLSSPQVALAITIAKDCRQAERDGSNIDHHRYSAWRAEALADVER